MLDIKNSMDYPNISFENNNLDTEQFILDKNQLANVPLEALSNYTNVTLEDGTPAMLLNDTVVLNLENSNQFNFNNSTEQEILTFNNDFQEPQKLLDNIIVPENIQLGDENIMQLIQNENPQFELNIDQPNFFLSNDVINELSVDISAMETLPTFDMPLIQESTIENTSTEINMLDTEKINIDTNKLLDVKENTNNVGNLFTNEGLIQFDHGSYTITNTNNCQLDNENQLNPTENLLGPISDSRTDDPILPSFMDHNYFINNYDPVEELADYITFHGKNETLRIATPSTIDLEQCLAEFEQFTQNNNEVIKQSNVDSNNINGSNTPLKELINKTITLGKTEGGKVLVGKIIDVTKKKESKNSTKSSQPSALNLVNNKNSFRNGNIRKKVGRPNREEAINRALEKFTKSVKDKYYRVNTKANPKTYKAKDSSSVPKIPKSLPSPSSLSSSSTSTSSSFAAAEEIDKEIKTIIDSIANKNDSKKIEEQIRSEQKQNELKIIIQKKVISADCFDLISRTLIGLMDMDSVVKKLKNRLIILKVLENIFDNDTNKYVKSVSYCSGYMVRELKINEDANNIVEAWKFIPDSNCNEIIPGNGGEGSNNSWRIANLTINITVSPHGGRTTRVLINPSNMYRCQKCTQKFRTSNSFNTHLKNCMSQVTIKQYCCEKCTLHFNNAEEYKRHSEIHEDIDTNFMYGCVECNMRFTTSIELGKHMKIHFQPLKCRHCEERFAHVKILRSHLEKEHSKDFKSLIENTTQNRNNDENVMDHSYCEICKKKFSHSFNMEKHMEMHKGESKNKCSICNNLFNYSSSCTRHMVSSRLKEMTNLPENQINYPCDVTLNQNLPQDENSIELIAFDKFNYQNIDIDEIDVSQYLNIAIDV